MDPLYLKVIDGKPVDHPTFESNLLEVFGRVPKNYVPFTRLPRPPLESKGVFQKFADTYVLSACGEGVRFCL